MRIRDTAWDVLTSLKLTIVCLSCLMVLVVACTLAQVNLGTVGAVDAYIRSWAVWWDVPGTGYAIPIFPGGALVGLVLGVNLVAAQGRRLEWSAKKSGIWIAHAGLILLVVGEFVSSAFQVDAQLSIEEGQTLSYVERPREFELAVVDASHPEYDDEYGVPDRRLARGGTIAVPGTPVSLHVREFYWNAELFRRQPTDPPAAATAGLGTGILVRDAPPVVRDDRVNQTTALVEVVAGGVSKGTFLVSNVLDAPQTFEADGKKWRLAMRSRREHLPFTLTLKDFRHDVYAGTDIPKNFSSLVHLSNPSRGEERDVLIYMNQPLRYEGRAFYQASFGKGDTLSVLQVVRNPGWLLPYVSCALVTAGLLIHFGISLARGMRRRPDAALEG